MSVGGKLININRITFMGRALLLLVVKDGNEPNMVVHAEPTLPEFEPKVGEMVWWQGKLIYYDNDQHSLVKVGSSGIAALDSPIINN